MPEMKCPIANDKINFRYLHFKLITTNDFANKTKIPIPTMLPEPNKSYKVCKMSSQNIHMKIELGNH